MVLYIKEYKGGYIYFGYTDYTDGVANYSGLKDDVATKEGYTNKKLVKDNAVIPEVYIAGYSKDIDKVITDDIESLIIHPGKLRDYVINGETPDGLKDKDFTHHDKVKSLKDKVVPIPTSDTYGILVKELTALSNDEVERSYRFEDKKYLTPTVKKPLLLRGSNLLVFPGIREHDGKKLYVTVNQSDDTDIGKQAGTISNTILLNDGIAEVESLIAQLPNELNIPVIINITKLFSSTSVRLAKYNTIITKRFTGAMVLSLPGEDPIATIYSPPGLLFVMGNEIKTYLSIPTKSISLIDRFYKDKKILPGIENNFSHKLDIEGTVVRYEADVDTLDRNHIKRIEKVVKSFDLNYSIHGKVIKYSTIIKTEEETAIVYSPRHSINFIK